MNSDNFTAHSTIGLLLTAVMIGCLAFAIQGESGRMEQKAAALDKARLRRGRELFVTNCTTCHGTRGEGIVGPALNNKVLLEGASKKQLFEIIRAGRPGTTMPAWAQEHGGPLTDGEIREVVRFLKAWEEDAPVVVADRYEPTAVRGASLFADTCFICHGENGRGGTAPAINDPVRLAEHDDPWYRQTIVSGRPAKGMPIWGDVLSPNQVDDLIELIRAWRSGEEVATETTVAELVGSALFALGQGDADDALFYLDRARPLAFGPALERFASIEKKIAAGDLHSARAELDGVYQAWPTGDAAAGAAVYQATCASCHGRKGQGGVGRRLQPSAFVQQSTNAEMLRFLFTGRPGTAMRSFKGQLTERQLADVIAFLRTWQGDRGILEIGGMGTRTRSR